MIVGHEDLIADFKHLIDNGHLAHGYIFCGPARLGKRQVALRLASYAETGCFETDQVLQESMLIEPDPGGTIGIDAVRAIKQFLWQMPVVGGKRIVVVDRAETMTTEAQNAILKITEEPPAAGLLILVTEDVERLLPTIQSRFQKINFLPVPIQKIKEWLTSQGASETQAETAAAQSFGLPGLAWALGHDDALKESLAMARKLLKAPRSARNALLKDIVGEEFDLDKFLEALTIDIVPVEPKQYPFWHALHELRRDASSINVNPRLQLAALIDALP